jgi:pyruvate formate lyase activating enzyme
MKESAVKPIYSITPFTLLDYPHKSACILWFAGCNMRCSYCYNPEIVHGKGTISYQKAITFIQSRQNLLDAVVFSGGECLLHKDIITLITTIKNLGFFVKIDTNGSKPEVMQKLIERGLVDYVALDFKAMPSRFEKITQSNLFLPFEKSLHLLLQSGILFEVRTTVHSDLINEKQLEMMIAYLEKMNYTGDYYIQYFINDVVTLENLGYSSKKLHAKSLCTKNIKVHLRG